MVQFDEIISRKGTSSVKWDQIKTIFGTEEALPMWVADMDFRAPQEVIEALKKKIEHGVFGYTTMPDSAIEAVCQWMEKRHHFPVQREWLLFSPGVVPSISLAIQALTEEGDEVLVQPPIYPPFFNMVKANNRKVAYCPLVLKGNQYEIDFDEFEQLLKTRNVRLFLLCSPHNPGGRVWTKEELTKIADLCQTYQVWIVSDEIHSDLTALPNKHIPIASIKREYREFVITCIAPSKTFNLAGLQASCIIVPNPKIRNQLSRVQKRQGFFQLNMMGMAAMEAAYRYGEKWLDEAISYIRGNVELVKQFIEKEIPSLKVMEPQGGYLIWIDCRETGLTDQEIKERLLFKGKLALESGPKYGPGGEGFVRMNVGCPRSLVEEGLKRMKAAFSEN